MASSLISRVDDVKYTCIKQGIPESGIIYPIRARYILSIYKVDISQYTFTIG